LVGADLGVAQAGPQGIVGSNASLRRTGLADARLGGGVVWSVMVTSVPTEAAFCGVSRLISSGLAAVTYAGVIGKPESGQIRANQRA
jgi:hypothetical protein